MPSKTPHIILIDGQSGVGKTTLSLTMADALGATVIHLDDVYPGWGGLVAGRDAVIDGVLRNVVDGRAGRVRRWDWEHSAPGIDVIVPGLERLFNASFLPKDIYLISRMPSEPLASDIVPIAVIALLLAFAATLYPSWRASRVNPAEALRYE